MEYQGRYAIFNPRAIRTYPVSQRQNKVHLSDLAVPQDVLRQDYDVGGQAQAIADVAQAVVDAIKRGRSVIWLTGAHLIKNGLGPLLIDLVRRGVLTLKLSRRVRGAVVRVQVLRGVRYTTVARGRVSGNRIPVALTFSAPGRYVVRAQISEANRPTVGRIIRIVVRR